MKKCDEELFSLKGQRNSNEDDEKKRQNLFGLLRTQVVEQLDMTRELTDDELYASIDEVFDDAAVQKTIFSAGFDAAKTGIV